MIDTDTQEFDPVKAAQDLWQLQMNDSFRLDRIHRHLTEKDGLPKLPDEASEEVIAIKNMCFKNVLTLVRDSFAQNLSVVGYRSSDSGEDSPAWSMWQRNKMDARQSEIYRPALTFGTSYVAVLRDDEGNAVFRPRSPRQMLAVYNDPQVDEWPVCALETWVETVGNRRVRKGYVYSDTHVYPMHLGLMADENAPVLPMNARLDSEHEPFVHGASHVPVVRFVNMRDSENAAIGEVEPLISLQRQINEVNFDRLIVARFGAFPQKVISGWSGSKAEVLAASARRVWAFDDPDVKAQSFAAANPEAYTGVINDLFEHVAMIAQISPAQVTGQIVNVSADALASAEANQQRKLSAMRESFGESFEQMLALGAEIEGLDAGADDDEVIWRNTEARSFAAVVDGITKLAQSGVPIAELLHLVPGMTQRQIRDIRQQLRTKSFMDELRESAAKARSEDPTVDRLASRTTASPVEGQPVEFVG